jgi:hypothetical protein
MSQSSSSLPLQLLSSGQILMISPDCTGALILQKPFFAEFVGHGAIVGGSFDIQCQSIYAIGDVQFISSPNEEQRRAAFQRRVEYIQAMQSILLEEAPLRRAKRLFEQMCDWIGTDHTLEIPREIGARLAGVFPKSIEMAWYRDRIDSTEVHHSDQIMAHV